ncbi:MAG TPA: hypothetical protein EYG46_15900 [Myxococcales bacterium]|nr:hypothetical protein [Myxococcales bacterium]
MAELGRPESSAIGGRRRPSESRKKGHVSDSRTNPALRSRRTWPRMSRGATGLRPGESFSDSLSRSSIASCRTGVVAMPARTKNLIFVVAIVFLVACGGNGNNGGSGDDECESRSCKLTASDTEEFDRFGAAVATSGEVTVVGASFDDDGDLQSGSAYVFRSEGTAWFEEQKLSASDADAFDAFGTSVAFADDVVVVGAPGNAAAYVFRFDGTDWLEEQMLTPIGAGLLFGTSVSISGDAIAVGAPGSDKVFVYRFDAGQWEAEQTLDVPPLLFSSPTDVLFGASVACSDGSLAVGSPRNNDVIPLGFAFVYRFDGTEWEKEQDFLGSTEFGSAVAISGDVVVVGASADNDLVEDTPGSAFVKRFNGTEWLDEQELVASNPIDGEGDVFGVSVAVSGDRIVIGSRRNDDVLPSSGSAYVYSFDGTTWVEEQILTAPDAAPLDIFGDSVSISDDVIAVGSAFKDGAGPTEKAGATYVFRL